MTNLINPESGKTNWAIFSQADKLSTSKGERKLRADLAMLLGGKEAKHMDQTHHLAVALEGNKIREHKADKPLVAGSGQVAVKIKTERGL